MKAIEPKLLYEKLLAFYGPQSWWPGEGFEIAIGAILTQNVSWKNAKKAIDNLKDSNLLSIQAINKAKINLIAPQTLSTSPIWGRKSFQGVTSISGNSG